LKNGELLANKIKAYGKIGFGINAYDQLDGAYNKNGLYSLEMLVNGKKTFQFKATSFSFYESKFINLFIDYERFADLNQRIQKCFIEPENGLSLYTKSINNGYLTIEDGLSYTVEIIANNFTSNEIEGLGKIIIRQYDGHKAAGVKNHITISPRKCANTLVRHINDNKKTFQLIKLLIEMDDSALNGKSKIIEGLESYLNKLAKSGIYYDFKKRKLHHSKKDAYEMINWGTLKDGKVYSITVMSLDIVNNSKMVKKYSPKIMEKVYFRLRAFIGKKVLDYEGRIWNFAGDGGLIAFTFKGHAERAVLCAMDIRATLPIFNISHNLPIKDNIFLRLALDSGRIKFSLDTGHIVSDIINYAAHLEKSGTLPGEISISGNVKKDLPPKIAKIFSDIGVFENTTYYSTV
ncbi:MAG: hypothetical protein L3J12_02295, partial [Spirochaetales bacterium]|nr:hypothetical protein [Spirochaetales bacterium]